MIAAVLFLIAAPVDSEALAAARTAYESARYEEVIKKLRDGDFSALERTSLGDALFMLGVSELALGNEALSQRALVRLFTEVPDFEWPLVAKKVVAALDRARKQVGITLHPMPTSNAVKVCGSGLPKRADVKIVFTTPSGESGGPATYESGCFSRPIPKDQNANGYYVIANIDNEPRATAGSRMQPLPLDVKEESKPAATAGTPWYKHWLTWTIVGVVVAGGVTAAAVGGSIAARNAADGTVRVNVTVPQ